MAERFLRVKGILSPATVYDTQDLGATQGASMALLDAPVAIANELKIDPQNICHIGASQGLFRVAAEQAEKLAKDARAFLRRTDPFRHLCFQVEIADSEEAAIAQGRLRQLQELSLPLPERAGEGCCPVDRRRPGTEPETIDGKDVWVSASVKARRDYRNDHRQSFYRHEIGVQPRLLPRDGEQGHSFHDIVRNPPADVPESLRNKLAVLFFDGNGFGAVRRDMGPQAFGEKLKSLRCRLMEEMLPAMGGLEQSETILWGGDEMMWVVPSWQVWDCLTAFFRNTAKEDWIVGGRRLVHRGGVVVCHYKTPIRLAKTLAEELANKAKDAVANTIQIEILESLDIPERYLDRQRQALFGAGVDEAAFTLRGEDWAGLTDRLKRIRAEDGFPRSQLYRLLRKARDDKGALTRPVPDELAAVLGKGKYALEAGDLCADPVDLARIATVWDYVR